MSKCICGDDEQDHALEVLSMEMPHEFGPVRSRLLTYKQRRGACGLCGCEGYEERVAGPLTRGTAVVKTKHAVVPGDAVFVDLKGDE
jgi:positive regulator of sigma E activity